MNNDISAAKQRAFEEAKKIIAAAMDAYDPRVGDMIRHLERETDR